MSNQAAIKRNTPPQPTYNASHLEAEAIIDDVPVNFIELVAMSGSISEVTQKHEALAAKYGQRVMVLHIGSISRILKAMQGES